ncbi:MAG: leucine-rich repeat protein, partial [Kiritimatiellae bacterium]|nr:leucine-rich repeat protein [Kiritimatiellia bacterium]
GFEKLSEVEMGANVASIGEVAFSNCTALVRLVLPDSVESVGTNAFYGCDALEELEVPGAWHGTDALAEAGVPAGCTVVYRGWPTVATRTLPTAVAEIPYETTLAATGGTGPYTWSATDAWFAETAGENTFAATGTAQGWQADESTWDLELPFAFPFFGKTYTQAKISSQGAIALGTNDFPYSIWGGTPVIAAMWMALGTGSGDIYLDSGADWVTVRWQGNYFSYYDGSPVNFSATLHADGTIELKYGDGNRYGGTIGLGAEDGLGLYSEMNSAGDMANAADIVFTPSWGMPLPWWLELSEDGVLRGVTETAGEYSFSVMATDAEGVAAQRDLTLTVTDVRWIVEADCGGRGRTVPSRVVATNGMTVTITADGDGREFDGWSWTPEVGATCTGTTWTWTVPEGSGQVGVTASFQPRDFHVDAAEGNDGNAGTEDAPLANIQTAIDRAGDGETVWVAPGTYGPIWCSNRLVRIAATGGPEDTVIDVTGTTNRCAVLMDFDQSWSDCGDGGCMALQTNTVLEGFTLRGANLSAYDEYSSAGAVFGGTLVNCTVTGNAAGYGAGQAFGVAERCRFLGNTAARSGG